MSFVKDVTIGEGESVPPDTTFTKTWRIQNTGGSPGVGVSRQRRRASDLKFELSRRCRVVASGCLSEVRGRRPVRTREHGDGALSGSPGNDGCQCTDAQPSFPWHVPGSVENVHSNRTLLWRWGVNFNHNNGQQQIKVVSNDPYLCTGLVREYLKAKIKHNPYFIRGGVWCLLPSSYFTFLFHLLHFHPASLSCVCNWL